MRERVQQVVNRLRPAIRQDGSEVELLSVEAGVVKLRLTGSCAGCASSMMTLRLGLERAIQAEVPEVKGVELVSPPSSPGGQHRAPGS